MKKIRDEIAKLASGLGVDIVDVRLVRTELPVENQPAVFERFNQMLIKSAKGNRAEGEKKAKVIQASADKEKVILLAEAKKKAQSIRAKGDAMAMEITSSIFAKDPEFYSFFRSLESYKQTIGKDTDIYLAEDHPYLEHFFKPPLQNKH
jgi:membrane protease subunit HflC